MNISKLLGFLGTDKMQHFSLGTVITVLVAAACAASGKFSVRDTFAACFIVALAAGAIKEFIDAKLNRKTAEDGLPPAHSVDPWDVAATTLGGVYVGGLFWLADLMGR